MAAAASAPATQPLETTLLDLVQAVDEVAESEAEVVATVLQMLRSGRVRLLGNFRGSILEDV